MGNEWGPEGPPPEAYSRVTNPERFAPLLDMAGDLLDRLESEFEVTREEDYGLDERLEHNPTRPTVRLTPTDAEAGSLTVGFTKFPGTITRIGHWFVVPLPFCGCDACDETVEECENELIGMTEALTSGRFREWIELPPIGAGRYHHDIGTSRGWSRLERVDAKAWIERAGGRGRFDYTAWPRRGAGVTGQFAEPV